MLKFYFYIKKQSFIAFLLQSYLTNVTVTDPQLNALARLTLGAASRSLRRSQLTSLLRQLSLLLHGGATVSLRAVEEERNTGRAVVTFLAGEEL